MSSPLLVSARYALNRLKMLALLTELGATVDAASFSLYIPPGKLVTEVEGQLDSLLMPEIKPEGLAGLAAAAKNGAIVFGSPSRVLLVMPNFPVKVNYLSRGDYLVEPLRSLLAHDYRIAFILIRLGSYAIGLCEGDRLVISKVGTGLVHARHRQGGSSANRFRRHREKQIEYFMTRVGGHLREHLEPYAEKIDYIVYGGAQTTITLLQKQCSFLGRLKGELLPPLLDIADPRQAVLEKAVRHVWSCDVTEWRRESGPLQGLRFEY
jgi:hypothetical protein